MNNLIQRIDRTSLAVEREVLPNACVAFSSVAYDAYAESGQNIWVFDRAQLGASCDPDFVREVALDALSEVAPVQGRECSCAYDCCGHVQLRRAIVKVGPRFVVASQFWLRNL